MTTLSNNLKRLRTDLNLTQKQLSEIAGVQEKSYQAWERRGIEPPIEKLKLLANFYQLTIDELINDNSVIADEMTLEQRILTRPENVQKAIWALLEV